MQDFYFFKTTLATINHLDLYPIRNINNKHEKLQKIIRNIPGFEHEFSFRTGP